VDRFDHLFRRFYAELYGLACAMIGGRLETEDVVQEAFLRLVDAPVLGRPDEEVRAWLRRVCLNLSFNRIRDAKRARTRLERAGRQDLAAADPTRDEPSDLLLRREAQEEVRRALAHLPERNCLLLRHAGYSYAEIAATVGIATGSVGVLLARGERAFREIYEENERAAAGARLP
jgi:RNA polymerase sigma-70 factor (ECF subfamily)